MNARAAAATVRERLELVGVSEATFEAELLVRQAAGISRAAFFSGAEIDAAALRDLGSLTGRRMRREPAAYLAGRRAFYGLDIAVAPGALIPRPETELLVEIALDELHRLPDVIIVDVGTGSGCVAAAIAVHADTARIIATDVSLTALNIASTNFCKLAPRVAAMRCNLAAGIRDCDIVVANLPYIPSGVIPGLEPEVHDWEPRLALDGGDDGMELIRRLVDDCAARLRPRLLALEVMAGQAQQVAAYAESFGATVAIRHDLAGIERVVTARWA